jgi:pyruvate,orthophosphate dikinase
VNAQGEDVVAGLRTPQPLTEASRNAPGGRRPSLEGLMPAVFADLKAACAKLEAHFRDIQDIEFTVEEGKLCAAGQAQRAGNLEDRRRMASQGLMTEKEAAHRCRQLIGFIRCSIRRRRSSSSARAARLPGAAQASSY